MEGEIPEFVVHLAQAYNALQRKSGSTVKFITVKAGKTIFDYYLANARGFIVKDLRPNKATFWLDVSLDNEEFKMSVDD